MNAEVQAQLQTLDESLSGNLFAQEMLQPGATDEQVRATGNAIGVSPSTYVTTLYAWHNGAAFRPAGTQVMYLFPPFWEFLPLEEVERQARWPLEWLGDIGETGFPFALDETGQFLVAASGERDVAWRVSTDHPGVPAWPDGSLTGLIRATHDAIAGHHPDYVLDAAHDRFSWRPIGGPLA